jgi:uroporphyrinogen-III synthase
MSAPRKKIWITRTQPAAEATADRVRALGHRAFVAPLLEVKSIPGRIDLEDVAALAFTSANGVAAFVQRAPQRDLRVYAVGAATAAAARAAGFKTVLHTSGGVASLAEALASRRRELTGVVLHPGAAEPAGDLVGMLEGFGVAARGVTVYETIPTVLTEEQLAQLGELDAVLLHSARAAKILAGVLRTHPAPQLRALALSKAALRPLSRSALAARQSTESPLEADLLNLIDISP